MAKLYIVPTPIGNLEDITIRALRILTESDLILAEDTRKTNILLKHNGISKPLISYHAFNEHASLSRFVFAIKAAESAALVSDAGTPGISDPGYLLVRECLKEGIPVECLPGPTALIPALINSGIASDRFRFEGFLPHKKGRQTRLAELSAEKITLILYESPHRLIRTLEQLCEYFGEDRRASVARELTKVYEETKTGTLRELLNYYKQKEIKGEIVIVISGK